MSFLQLPPKVYVNQGIITNVRAVLLSNYHFILIFCVQMYKYLLHIMYLKCNIDFMKNLHSPYNGKLLLKITSVIRYILSKWHILITSIYVCCLWVIQLTHTFSDRKKMNTYLYLVGTPNYLETISITLETMNAIKVATQTYSNFFCSDYIWHRTI